MKKRVIGILFVILFSAFTLAQSNESFGDIGKAYLCLEKQINEKASLSLQDAIFGTLALGSNQKLDDVIRQEKGNEACWPKTCNIKESAQVLLSYRGGKSSKDIENWLLSKSMTSKDLIWYLEIDIQNHLASECNIKYDTNNAKIKIKEDMTLEGSPGRCLSISYGGYWLQISNECIDKEFEISCDKDFVTTLVYQRKSGENVFVSSDTHSSASLGTTSEKVNSKCFSTGNACDYEGTLWAAMGMKKQGREIKEYIPYLLALAESNKKYFPHSFLYILIGGEDKYSEIVQNQKGEYWEIIGSPYNRFYDTSLALLALAGSGSGEAENARNYLLRVQTKEGCWNNNNIRDTAFILYSGWPKAILGGSVGGGGAFCESSGYFCGIAEECIENGGSILNEYQCVNFRETCCSRNPIDATCDEKGGIVCSSSQRCTGREAPSADGSCCLEGACENIQSENLCALSNGLCKSGCASDEEIIDESCPDVGDVCCIEKEKEETSSAFIWIIIFSALILLVLIAIIFRRKIQIWWHSRKGRESKKSSGPSRPGAYGMSMQRMPRYGPPGQVYGKGPSMRSTRGPKSEEDKEFEETMKKLKDMSK